MIATWRARRIPLDTRHTSDETTRRQIITARSSWSLPDLRDLWNFRELLTTLTLRDIKVRYKQTAIGILWAIIQPVVMMVVFTVIFGKLGKLPSNGLPYSAFVLAALLPWQLFAKALTQGSLSMVALGSIMSKVYFPRLIAPLSSVLSGVVDFVIGLGVLLVIMAWYQLVPGLAVLLAPLFVLLALMAALAASLWLSVINAQYRDVQHALPFATQVLLILTPVLYPTSIVPEGWRMIYALNPMVTAIEGFRWSLLGGSSPDLVPLLISAGVTLAALVGGLFFFAHYEKSFVDQL
jgi:lipopolysaccharide transport system permease protein